VPCRASTDAATEDGHPVAPVIDILSGLGLQSSEEFRLWRRGVVAPAMFALGALRSTCTPSGRSHAHLNPALDQVFGLGVHFTREAIRRLELQSLSARNRNSVNGQQ
ncbi:unnamed protein product, partial [Polarella glacialis]